MHRSRYPSEVPFSRRDGMSRAYEVNDENNKVELFVKFRTFRPYLKKRMDKILKDGRKRELKDEFEDIEYYLSVMSDMCADDNHGADALQGFIDRIHEMIRKNPNNDSHASSHTSPDDEEDDAERERAPRSPSPTEDSDEPTTIRSIPLEREQQAREFTYFGSLEGSLSNRPRPVPSSISEWGLDGGNDSFSRRGGFQDVDMRDESRYQPMENSDSLGRGVSVNSSRRWPSDDIGTNSFARGVRVSSYSDKRPDPNQDYNRSFTGSTERFTDNRNSGNRWSEGNNWNSIGRGTESMHRTENFDRNRGPSEYPSRPSDEGYSWDRPYERPSAYSSREPSYDRQREPIRKPDEPLFERRPSPQFERRRPPSDASVQIDYNHGGGGSTADDSWDRGSDVGGLDKDMRGVPQIPNEYENSFFTPDPNNLAQRFIHNAAVNQLYLASTQGGALNPLMNINQGMPNIQQTLGVSNTVIPPQINMQNIHGVQMGYNHQPLGNNRPGLLPTPSANILNQDFGFRNANAIPQFQRAAQPPPIPDTFHANPANDPSYINSSASSSNLIREMSKQKAQQCFSRKDNQNVPPPKRTPTAVPPTNTSIPPPSKPLQGSMLATNQMLSDRDPRLHRQKKINPTNQASQNRSSVQQSTSTESRLNPPAAGEVRRTEESRLSSKNQNEIRDRSPTSDPRNNHNVNRGGVDSLASRQRDDIAPLDPRRARFLAKSTKSADTAPAPLDPRGTPIREERPRGSSSDSRQEKNKDDHRDRNKSADPRGASKSRDEIRDRTVKPGRDERTGKDERTGRDETQKEVCDRVRANIHMSAPKPTAKPTKLQQIRKQVEKEGFHALGRHSNKKNTASFDEALNPPIPKSPPRALSKSPTKHKSRNSSTDKTSPNNQKQSSEDQSRGGNKITAGSKQSRAKGKVVDEEKGTKKRNKRQQSKNNLTTEDDVAPEKPAPTKYRIPKIKRPDPPPPPREPTPPPVSPEPEVYDSPDESPIETPTQVADDDVGAKNMTSETEELVKRFIRQSVDANEADSILKNEDAISQVFLLLKQQVQQLFHDEQPSVPSASPTLNSNATEVAPANESVTELPTLSIDDSKDAEPTETGTHRSRSTTRKKSAKRRSSLEKLHDALQEMGFDADLPLGPRKCTRAPVVKSSEVPSVTTGVTEPTPSTKKTPKIMLNKDDLTHILARTENKQQNNSDNSVSVADPESNSITEDTKAVDESEETAATSVPGRRGRKRKRKGSKLKPNKKKKGPVTRAQLAVKTALKHQQKDKVQPANESEPTEILPKNKRKLVSQTRGSKTEGRVTRSRSSGIVTNPGLEKIKLECDYIAPKEEPNEDHLGDSITAGTGYEHLENGEVASDKLQQNPAASVSETPTFIEFPPSCLDLLFNNNDEDDRMSIESLNIKYDPDYDSIADENVQQEQEEEQSIPVAAEPETILSSPPTLIKSEPEDDTDYDIELSFLPILPRMDDVYSVSENLGNEVVDALYLKTLQDPPKPRGEEIRKSKDTEDCTALLSWMVSNVESHINDTREVEVPRNERVSLNSSHEIQDCEDVLNWIVANVEFQVDDFAKTEFQSQMDLLDSSTSTSLKNLSQCNSSDISGILDSDLGNSSSELDEPNDFYIIDDSSSSSSSGSDEEDDTEFVNKTEKEATKEVSNTVFGDLVASNIATTLENPTPVNALLPIVKEELVKQPKDSGSLGTALVAVKNEQVEEDLVMDCEDSNSNSNMEEEVSKKLKSKLEKFIEEGAVCGKDEQDEQTVDSDNNSINLEGLNLYRCANPPCIFRAMNSTLFKDHINACIFVPESKQVSCYHCDKRVKAIPNLLEHLKVHGRRKQLCSMCPFKTWFHSELTRHMKTIHKVYNFKVEKIEIEGDEEPDVIVFPKEVACRMINVESLKENFSRYADRLVFGPDDIDKVPGRHIFQSLAYCSMCSYATKVRVNIVRHLKLHSSTAQIVPETDPVNPVPCLERKELMFDKMTNWAGSTHAHKPGPAAPDNSAIPSFVLEQFRYVCSVPSCKQITTDDSMLRAHMRALHSAVEVYRCPHCYKEPATRKDARNTVPVEKLGNHLKLHGGKLYRCNYCDYIHHHPAGLEKHLPEKHPEKKPIHYLIRHVDANGVFVTRSPEDESTSSSGKWRCNVCNSKNLLPSYNEAKEHCRQVHKVLGQFICAYCRYFTDSDTEMKTHVLENCAEKISEEGQIMVMWVRNEFADAIKSEDSFHGPLWKRSSHNVKHIRGIFLEDVQEKARRSDNSVISKTMNSSDPSDLINSSATSVKKSSGKVAESTKNGSSNAVTSANSTTKSVPGLMVCPKCSKYKTSSREFMTVHLYNEFHYLRYGCPKCDLKFVTETSLKGHYSRDHALVYDEKLCQLLPVIKEVEDYIQNYYDSLDAEAKAAGPVDGKSGEGPVLCKHCGHPCNSYHNLKTHILAKHLASDRYKCSHCSLSFYSQGLGFNHIKKAHPETTAHLNSDQELESMFTPEFWMNEYGIPSKKGPKRKSISSPTKKDTSESSGLNINHKVKVSSDRFKCSHCSLSFCSQGLGYNHIKKAHPETSAHITSEQELESKATPDKDYGIPAFKKPKKKSILSQMKKDTMESPELIDDNASISSLDEMDYETAMEFKCPLCNYTSEDRNKLNIEHVNKHICVYLCPIRNCGITFETHSETTFHIRHSHADPNSAPVINPRLYEEREKLERQVVEVAVRRRKDQNPLFKPFPKALKRKISIPSVPSPVKIDDGFDNNEAENMEEEEDDDIIIEGIVIVNPPLQPLAFQNIFNSMSN